MLWYICVFVGIKANCYYISYFKFVEPIYRYQYDFMVLLSSEIYIKKIVLNEIWWNHITCINLDWLIFYKHDYKASQKFTTFHCILQNCHLNGDILMEGQILIIWHLQWWSSWMYTSFINPQNMDPPLRFASAVRFCTLMLVDGNKLINIINFLINLS